MSKMYTVIDTPCRPRRWKVCDPRDNDNSWVNYFVERGEAVQEATARNAVPEISRLRAELAQADHAYHVLSAPVMADEEYDQLAARLLALERQYPLSAKAAGASPSATVGAPSIEPFAKVRHARKMLSLAKVFSPAEVVAFFPAGGCGQAEFKLDGLSLHLDYVNGRLQRAVTRGDGETGDDVTANAATIATIPKTLTGPMSLGSVAVRGEVLMPRGQFDRLNAELLAADDEPFANCRNAAAGSMKQRDPAECARRGLSFSAYWSSEAEYTDLGAVRDRLAASGFRVEMAQRVDLDSAEISAVLEKFGAARAGFEFDTDGVVISLPDPADRAEAGYSRTYPNWAVAFKFPAERKPTKLLDITLTVGRTGQITPNAVLAPVSLAGAVVQAASLCNADEIERLGVNVGDLVLVERANEVIPRVVGLVTADGQLGKWTMPSGCPSCRTTLIRSGVHFFCPNDECPEQVFGRLAHAVGKGALDIDGCGESAVRALIAHGVKTLSGLFEPGAELALAGAARAKFVIAREAAKQQPLWRKIYALGAEHIGRTASKELAARFRSVLHICEARREDLRAVVGPVACESLLRTLVLRADEIDRLDQLGVKFESEQAAGRLTGKTFCITGTMLSGSRDQVERRIEAAGGMVKGSVSKKVTYLVSGPGGGANKAAAAAKCGTTVITEQQLYALLGEPMPEISAEEREF